MEVRERVYEESVKWVGPHPLTFEEFRDEYGPDDSVELIDGVVVGQAMVPIEHARLFRWLRIVPSLYATKRQLGEMLGSRTAVEINQFRGRVPDLLFIPRDRIPQIVRRKAVYGAPDLVIEIVSPNDRPSNVVAVETDYRTIGVTEIVFLDPRKHQAHVLRRRESGYEEEVLTSGALTLETMGALLLEIDWLCVESLPDKFATLEDLLGQAC